MSETNAESNTSFENVSDIEATSIKSSSDTEADSSFELSGVQDDAEDSSFYSVCSSKAPAPKEETVSLKAYEDLEKAYSKLLKTHNILVKPTRREILLAQTIKKLEEELDSALEDLEELRNENEALEETLEKETVSLKTHEDLEKAYNELLKAHETLVEPTRREILQAQAIRKLTERVFSECEASQGWKYEKKELEEKMEELKNTSRTHCRNYLNLKEDFEKLLEQNEVERQMWNRQRAQFEERDKKITSKAISKQNEAAKLKADLETVTQELQEVESDMKFYKGEIRLYENIIEEMAQRHRNESAADQKNMEEKDKKIAKLQKMLEVRFDTEKLDCAAMKVKLDSVTLKLQKSQSDLKVFKGDAAMYQNVYEELSKNHRNGYKADKKTIAKQAKKIANLEDQLEQWQVQVPIQFQEREESLNNLLNNVSKLQGQLNKCRIHFEEKRKANAVTVGDLEPMMEIADAMYKEIQQQGSSSLTDNIALD